MEDKELYNTSNVKCCQVNIVYTERVKAVLCSEALNGPCDLVADVT